MFPFSIAYSNTFLFYKATDSHYSLVQGALQHRFDVALLTSNIRQWSILNYLKVFSHTDFHCCHSLPYLPPKLTFYTFLFYHILLSSPINLAPRQYSPAWWLGFRLVKRPGEHFAKKWSEQKMTVKEVVVLYGTYQKYINVWGPNSSWFQEKWTYLNKSYPDQLRYDRVKGLGPSHQAREALQMGFQKWTFLSPEATVLILEHWSLDML